MLVLSSGDGDWREPGITRSPKLMVLMVILMRMQHLSPETKETLGNKAYRERLEPIVFKDLFWRPWFKGETGADREKGDSVSCYQFVESWPPYQHSFIPPEKKGEGGGVENFGSRDIGGGLALISGFWGDLEKRGSKIVQGG